MEKLILDLIDKMLEKHNVNTEYVRNNELINNEPWYSYYTLTQAEFDIFKIWAIKQIREKLRISKDRSETEFDYFNLMYGLKIQ